MDYEDQLEEIKNELYGTGIPAVHRKDAQKGDVPNRLAVVVIKGDTLALSFKGRKVGKIIRTEGQNQKVWQAQSIDTVVSEDLHRVAFELAAYHPPLK